MSTHPPLRVAILAYPGMTMLDAIGPNEVLANSPHFDVSFVSTVHTDVENDHGTLKLHGLTHYSECALPDILLVPGGPGDHAAMQDEALLAWIKAVDQQASMMASVCTGALILARAGLLKDRRACTHWACLDELATQGGLPQRRRFVQDGKYMTASGVSAGIDMALAMVTELVSANHARELRFGIEYFPNQVHIISSYTLPRAMLSKLAKKVMSVITQARQSLLVQSSTKRTTEGEEIAP